MTKEKQPIVIPQKYSLKVQKKFLAEKNQATNKIISNFYHLTYAPTQEEPIHSAVEQESRYQDPQDDVCPPPTTSDAEKQVVPATTGNEEKKKSKFIRVKKSLLLKMFKKIRHQKELLQMRERDP